MRSGLSLLEVLVAALIFSLALIPTIGLMTTSQKEVVKVQERLLAVHLAMSIVEDMRARRVATGYGAVRPAELAHLTGLVAAHRASAPGAAAAIDAMLESFRCAATVTASPSRVTAIVTWSEGGRAQRYTMEARLDP